MTETFQQQRGSTSSGIRTPDSVVRKRTVNFMEEFESKRPEEEEMVVEEHPVKKRSKKRDELERGIKELKLTQQRMGEYIGFFKK